MDKTLEDENLLGYIIWVFQYPWFKGVKSM